MAFCMVRFMYIINWNFCSVAVTCQGSALGHVSPVRLMCHPYLLFKECLETEKYSSSLRVPHPRNPFISWYYTPIFPDRTMTEISFTSLKSVAIVCKNANTRADRFILMSVPQFWNLVPLYTKPDNFKCLPCNIIRVHDSFTTAAPIV